MLEFGLLIILTLSRGLYGMLFEGDIATPVVTKNQTKAAESFIGDTNKLWKHGIVKYRFEVLVHQDGTKEDWFTEQDKTDIRSAMDHIAEKVPCIRFM